MDHYSVLKGSASSKLSFKYELPSGFTSRASEKQITQVKTIFAIENFEPQDVKRFFDLYGDSLKNVADDDLEKAVYFIVRREKAYADGNLRGVSGHSPSRSVRNDLDQIGTICRVGK